MACRKLLKSFFIEKTKISFTFILQLPTEVEVYMHCSFRTGPQANCLFLVQTGMETTDPRAQDSEGSCV